MPANIFVSPPQNAQTNQSADCLSQQIYLYSIDYSRKCCIVTKSQEGSEVVKNKLQIGAYFAASINKLHLNRLIDHKLMDGVFVNCLTINLQLHCLKNQIAAIH